MYFTIPLTLSEDLILAIGVYVFVICVSVIYHFARKFYKRFFNR